MGETSSVPLAQASAPLPPAGSGNDSAQSVPVTLQQTPAAFSAVSRPIQITGTVVATDPGGALDLRTSSGIISLNIQTNTNDQPNVSANAPGTNVSPVVVKQAALSSLMEALANAPQPLTLALTPQSNGQVQAALLLPPTVRTESTAPTEATSSLLPSRAAAAQAAPQASSVLSTPPLNTATPVSPSLTALQPLMAAYQNKIVTVTVLPPELETQLLSAFQTPQATEAPVAAEEISYFAKQDPAWLAQKASPPVGTLWNPAPAEAGLAPPSAALNALPTQAPMSTDTDSLLALMPSVQPKGDALFDAVTQMLPLSAQTKAAWAAAPTTNVSEFLPLTQAIPSPPAQTEVPAPQTTAQVRVTATKEPTAQPPFIAASPMPSAQGTLVQTADAVSKLFAPSLQTQKTDSTLPVLVHNLTTEAIAKPIALEVGQDVKLKVMSLLPAQESWPKQTLGNQSLQATFVGATPSGRLLWHADDKVLFVQQDDLPALPAGTKIICDPAPDDLPAVSSHTPSSSSQLEQTLPAMRELVAALTQINVAAAQSFVAGRLPNPLRNFDGTLLFFLSALKTGRLDEWLGPQTNTLLNASSKGELIKKALGELSDDNGFVQDMRAGDWQSWNIPIHYGQTFDKIWLYVRDATVGGDGAPAGSKAAHKTHFLIAMTLTRLGAMQVEGLSAPKQLDLVVRSASRLPDALPNSLRDTYVQTLEALGMTGTIHFQTGKARWIDVSPIAGGAAPLEA